MINVELDFKRKHVKELSTVSAKNCYEHNANERKGEKSLTEWEEQWLGKTTRMIIKKIKVTFEK